MEKLNIQTLGKSLLADQNFVKGFIRLLKNQTIDKSISKDKISLDQIIEDIRQLLNDLIQQQLENQLKEIIEDNNKILKEIKGSIINARPLHELNEDASFSQVHKLMDEERKKYKQVEGISDASLDKSISAFVELKVETIEEKMMNLDKRMKSMEDKYQTNLKSIWNVLSITQSAIFDHLKQAKQTKSCIDKSTIEQEKEPEKKSFFSMFKAGK